VAHFHCHLEIQSNIILLPLRGQPNVLFLQSSNFYLYHNSPACRARPSTAPPPPFLYLVTLIIFHQEYTFWISSLDNLFQLTVTPSLMGLKYSPKRFALNNPNVPSFLHTRDEMSSEYKWKIDVKNIYIFKKNIQIVLKYRIQRQIYILLRGADLCRGDEWTESCSCVM
jgi:hypothetical protein